MSVYKLFSESITLSDPAERFFDIQQEAWDACTKAKADLEVWYKEQGNIENVLRNYKDKSRSLVVHSAVQPLYDRLASEYEIYDISDQSYRKTCYNQAKLREAYNLIAAKYDAIIDEQEAAAEYRQERKENRGRWEGGGFGFEGAIKGAATAGAMNAVSGIGHSLVNMAGNAVSAAVAASSKKELYNDPYTLYILCEGVGDEIVSVFNAHIKLINSQKNKPYISSSFDSDKAKALLENAKKVPEKASELLIRSFTLYPWNYDLLKYIFVNYPQERANAWNISKRFRIDLTKDIEEAISREYADKDRSSEECAQEAKKRILSIMREYNISESATLDRLEQDCIGRLCAGYKETDKATCLSMMADISKYDAQDKIKKPFLKDIQQRVYDLDKAHLEEICQACASADKPTCFSLIDAINAYDTTEEIKAPFLKRVNQRLTAVDMELLEQLCQGYEAADKARCLSLIESVLTYDALDSNKERMIAKLEARIEAIEMAQLGELCTGYETAEKSRCRDLIQRVQAHDASQKCKTVWIDKLSSRIKDLDTESLTHICDGYENADESRCKSLIEDVNAFDTTDELKKEFLSKLEQRLKEIWAAEDGEIFDNIYLQTNIEDPAAIKKSIAYIKEQNDRTGIAQKYIDALNNCNPKTIKNARKYRNPTMRSVYTGLWGSLLISAIFTQFVFHLGIVITAVEAIAGIAIFCVKSIWEDAWDKLTINNTIFHPALTEGKTPTKKGVSSLLFVAVFTVILLVVTYILF